MRLRSVLFAALLVVVPSVALQAQTATGVYAYGAFDTLGVDTINIGNLNTHLAFPILNKPGRGLPLSYNLTYDSTVWTPVTSGGSTTWTLAPGAGWSSITQPVLGYVTYTGTTTGGSCATTNYIYHDPSGAIHDFPALSTSGPSCGTSATTTSGASVDGSGFAMSVTSSGTTVIDSNGSTFSPPVNTPSGAGTVVDHNGNELTVSAGGSFTDTLGMVALTVSGSPASYISYTYKDTHSSPQTIVAYYGTYTIQTAFGCSGISEYGPTVMRLLTSITYPDGSIYSFTYEPTPGSTYGNVTGRLASIQVPTGGTISYAYTGGISCADGGPLGLTRSLTNDPSGSTRTYSRTPSVSTTNATVLDGLTNTIQYSFVNTASGPFETRRQAFNAGATVASLDRVTCYNGASSSSCNTTVPMLPVTALDTYDTMDGSVQKGSTVYYEGLGGRTVLIDYDYGDSTSRGPVLRTETISGYGTFGPHKNTSSDIVTDGSGHNISSITYSYDGSTPVSTSGLPQHVTPFGTIRGNVTKSTVNLNSTPGHGLGGSLPKMYDMQSNLQYDDAGQLLSTTDAVGTVTTYTYDTYDAFVTNIALSSLSESTQITPDPNTGLPTLVVTNGHYTTYSYDTMLRQSTVGYPDGGGATWTYTPTGSPVSGTPASVFVAVLHAGTTSITQSATLDWYGRALTTSHSDDGGNDLAAYTYDANGNMASASNPYKYGVTPPLSHATYDVLGRQISIKEPDCTGSICSTKSAVPFGNTFLFTDEAGNQRKIVTDGLGRIETVFEPEPASSGTPGALLDVETDYLYNQNGVSSTHNLDTYQTVTWRTRTFTYDLLGRMVSIVTPEAGETDYTYGNNIDGFCAGDASQTCSRTDARGVVTEYAYDPLNRLTNIWYTTAGTTSASTSDITYGYDEASSGGLSILNGLGNRTSMTDSSGSTAWSYDAMGRIVTTQKTIQPCNPGARPICAPLVQSANFSYNLDGTVSTLQDFSGDTLTYSYTAAGMQRGVSDSSRAYAAPEPTTPPAS
jgi:YD repeat-containing protein